LDALSLELSNLEVEALVIGRRSSGYYGWEKTINWLVEGGVFIPDREFPAPHPDSIFDSRPVDYGLKRMKEILWWDDLYLGIYRKLFKNK
jgi:hypothetical protein